MTFSATYQKLNNLVNQYAGSLLKSSVYVFLFILLGRVVQFAKEVFVAKEIGISPDLDAFIMGALILSISINFLISPIAFALLPIFIRLRKYSIAKANELFNQVVLGSLGLGIICYVGLYFFMDSLLVFFVGEFSTENTQLTKTIIYLLSPFYFTTILNVIFGAYLNALKKNFLYSIYPAFPALFTILFFLFVPMDRPIFQQVYGFNVGSCIASIALIYACFKNGYQPVFKFRISKSMRICLTQWLPLILSSLLIYVNPIIDKQMAANLGVGSVSHLEYGEKIFSIFSGFAIVGLSTVLYPYYSEKVANKEYDTLVTFLKRTLKAIILPLIIGTAVIVFYSIDLIRILFERGNFLAEDTLVVSEIMNLYMISFPIMTIGIIGVRLMNALQLNRLVMYYSVVNLVLNVGLNIFFLEWLGLKGIALSTSIVYTVNAILMWSSIILFFRKRNNKVV